MAGTQDHRRKERVQEGYIPTQQPRRANMRKTFLDDESDHTEHYHKVISIYVFAFSLHMTDL
jgi:hypothetical protein